MSPLDLDSLRCFAEGARLLNFRAASRVVGLTPAAFSQRIKLLEQDLGTALFHRTTRRVTLTEAGLAVLPKALEALEAAGECRRAARGEAGPAPMELTLGTRQELGLSWVVPMLPELQARWPHVQWHFYFGSGPDLELRVRSGEVDCAVSSRRTLDPALDNTRLHREDYCLVGAPGLLATHPLRTPADARHHQLLDAHRELPLFGYWRDAPNAPDLSFKSYMTVGTTAAIRTLVLAQEGVAVLPRYLVGPDLAAGRLQEAMPNVTALHDWFRLYYRRDDPRVPVFRQLAATMRAQPLR